MLNRRDILRAAALSAFAGPAAAAVARNSMHTAAHQPSASPTPAPAPAGGPLADLRASLKDPSKPFTLIVTFELKADAVERFAAIADEAAAGTGTEAGVLQYDFHQSAKNPAQFVLFEQWRSLDDLAAHLALPHTQKLLAALGDITAKPTSLEAYQLVGRRAVPLSR